MLGFLSRSGLYVAGLIWLSVGQAQAQITDALSLRETVRRVTEHNPSLMAYAPRLKALSGDRASAGLKPPMELSAEADEQTL